jgi:5-methylcytosine-specific restriction endonuclease McrA
MTARKARISRRLREQVAEAAGYRCGYCRTPQHIVGYPLTIDHIVPEARGGTALEENLWLACVACNQYKGTQVSGRDTKTGRHVRLFNPRLQKWETHFRWNDDGTEIVGGTSCGRATVTALNLNRLEIVGARSLWAQVGWWPPTD